MSNEQAYAGLAEPSTGMSEYNRLEFLVRMQLNRICTSTIVKVAAVNGSLVDITPLVAQLDGAGNRTDHGTIHGVPFLRCQGGNSAVILDPKVGDLGIAIFAHNDISTVKATKKANVPGSRRKFDYADAMYIGGLLNADATQYLRFDDDGVTIKSSDPVTVDADLKVEKKFAANGATPQGKAILSAALPPTAPTADIVAAINAIRAALVANGIGQ